ncbi:MAG: hypothetical protein R3E54_06230 [Halioglobus sp.]
MKPYYLLWGYRKCGTTSLWQALRSSGVCVPDWDESNVWLASPGDCPALFAKLWGHQIAESPYLVDLSTLTHLSRADVPQVLGEFGFEPRYIVCRRDPAERWVSAFMHMLAKSADHREASAYIDFYSRFIGLKIADLLRLEQDLVSRDLQAGKKSVHGLLGPEYFNRAYPLGFTCEVAEADYPFRYFAETVDMLYKAPEHCTVLQLEDWPATRQWIAQTFSVAPDSLQEQPRNTSGVNAFANRALPRRVGRLLPRPLRRRARAAMELMPGGLAAPLDAGVQAALRQMVSDMLSSGGAP